MAAAPHATPGKHHRIVILVAIVISSLQGSPADAEVWPAPAVAQVHGPGAVLETGPLALWSNPALLSVHRGWSMGAGWLEPFSAPLLARTDAAASIGWRGWGLAAGATRFGSREFSASALALGLATTLATGRADGGVSLRRHGREPDGAWAVDLGLVLVPQRSVRLGVVSRSAIRAGRLEIAPEPEWEIAASWQRGPGTLSAALVRDAVGPISRTLAARLRLDDAWLQLTTSELAGGEARFALGVGVRLSGLIAAASRETGPILPESRAAVAGWQQGAARAPSLSTVAPRLPVVPPWYGSLTGPHTLAAATGDSLSEESTDDEGADPESIDSEAIERELDMSPELLDEEGEAALERLGGSYSSRPGLLPAPGKPVTSRAPLTLRGFWRWTVGCRTRAHRGLGMVGGGGLRLSDRRRFYLGVLAALSRDIGEPAGIDERRLTFEAGHARVGHLLIGAIDAGFGAALTLSKPGGRPGTSRLPLIRLASAARPTRSRVPAAAGAGVVLTPLATLRLLLWSAVVARDARPVGPGLWPSGGRYHRSETELSRRGTLTETTQGAAIEWSSHSGEARLALLAMRARYDGVGPRLLSGGVYRNDGTWISAATRIVGTHTDLLAELGLAPAGRVAGVFRLRARTPGRRNAISGEFLYLTRAAGFDAATAWPATATLNRLSLRLGLPLWHPGLRLSLGEEFEERWSPPGSTVPARRRWSREDRAGLRLTGARNTFTLEWSRRGGWQHPPPVGDLSARPRVGPLAWGLRAGWQWRPGGETVTIGLGHSLRGTAGNLIERWEVFCAGKRRVEWRLAVGVRPGASLGSVVQVEGDPLGGLRLAPSTSPSRVRFRLSLPVAGGGPGGGRASIFALQALAFEGLWGVSSRGPRLEVWCTVIGGHPEDRAPALR